MKTLQEKEAMEKEQGLSEIQSRQIKAGRRRMLIRLIEYTDEADFHKLEAFQAGYEAGRAGKDPVEPKEDC